MSVDPLHMINVTRTGTFNARSDILASEPKHVDEIFERLGKDSRKHLCLYFHGGMISERDGLEIAGRLLPELRDKGQTYPVFYVYECGPRSTAFATLDSIAKNDQFELFGTRVGWILRAWYKWWPGQTSFLRGLADAVADIADLDSLSQLEAVPRGGRAGQGFTDSDRQEFRDFLLADTELVGHLDKLADDLVRGGRDSSSLSEMDEPVLAGIRGAASAGDDYKGSFAERLVDVAERVTQRHDAGTDNAGVPCTVIEELLREFYIGQLVERGWTTLKGGITAAFRSNSGLSGSSLHVGTYFVQRLNEFLDKPANEDYKVSLVGHSAGGIYICKMLAEARNEMPDHGFHHVIMMAPGCNFPLFSSTVVARQDAIHSFRMFGMSCELEKDAADVPVYPGSMLYLVSGLLEGKKPTPLVGLECFYDPTRTAYDGREAVKTVRAFMDAGNPMDEGDSPRKVWSKATRQKPGLNCTTTKHTEFDADPPTLESLTYILRH